MKALSVKSIHALRIAMGQKTMEIRSKRTHYRGPLLICVSQREVKGLKVDDKAILGQAICVVDVVGCRAMLPGDEADACHAFIPGHFVWKLANLRSVVPFPVTGQLAMFDVDDAKIVFKSEANTTHNPQLTTDQPSRTNDARLCVSPFGVPPLPEHRESRASFALV